MASIPAATDSVARLEKETFGQADHIIILAQSRYAADLMGRAGGSLFFMGDNRNDQRGSASPGGIRPEDHLVGHPSASG